MMQIKKGSNVYRMLPETLEASGWKYKVDGPFKVMGQVENWLMVRRSGCAPLCLYVLEAVDAEGNYLTKKKEPR